MRLVIHSRGAAAAGLKRYNGAGIFCLIGRQLCSSGLKKVINATERENASQKLAEVGVNGARSSNKSEKLVKKVEVKKKARETVKRKSALPTTTSSPKVAKRSESTVNQLINSSSRGSGIVRD